MKLILLRHGESVWNLENRFTGWKDVGLTERGQQEALFSAKQLIQQNLKICSIYTSVLKRAIQTTEIIIDKLKHNHRYEKVRCITFLFSLSIASMSLLILSILLL